MQTQRKALYDRVVMHVQDRERLATDTERELQHCSDALLHAQTVEDFDAVMEQYKLLDGKLRRAGVMHDVFHKLINEIKEDYYR